MNISQILAVYNIRKALGKDGCEIEPTVDQTLDFTSRVLPFECRIMPRSQKHVEIIRAAEKKYPLEPSHGKLLRQL